MNSLIVAVIVLGCLLGVVFLGMALRRALPEHHLGAESKDVVRLAMGLVATMAALVLGLLITSAKSAFDTKRSEVIQMAAKVAFLDRVLAAYGADAAEARARFHESVEEAVQRIWPRETRSEGHLAPDTEAGNRVYGDIQRLSPSDETQRGLKAQAAALAIDLAELRSFLVAQTVASISKPLLIVLVSWLVIILLSFSLFAPPNATAIVALVVTALSLTGAIFLILKLDQPFSGLIRISSEPMLKALNQPEK